VITLSVSSRSSGGCRAVVTTDIASATYRTARRRSCVGSLTRADPRRRLRIHCAPDVIEWRQRATPALWSQRRGLEPVVARASRCPDRPVPDQASEHARTTLRPQRDAAGLARVGARRRGVRRRRASTWLPSQNGLTADRPHRQSAIVPRCGSIGRPCSSSSWKSPRTSNGPSG
jgi:hypothetical protein